MSTYSDRELAEIRELVEENHQILRSLQNRARLGTVVQIVKWAVIILAALGIYTVVQPVLEQVVGTYKAVQESASTVNEIKDSLPENGIDFGSWFSRD